MRNLTRRFLLSTAVAVGVLLPLHAPADAAATIAIDAAAVGEAFLFGDSAFAIVVTNPGTDALDAIVVSVEGDAVAGTVVGPVVDVGNADAKLDPGERWTYTATGVSVTGSATFTVSAVAPDASTVTASFPLVLTPRSPVDVSATTTTTMVTSGAAVNWSVQARNVGPYPISVGVAEGRVLWPDFVAPIPFTPLDGPTARGDGDDLFEPGEVWEWTFTAPVTQDASFLSVNISGTRVTLPSSTFGFSGTSAPVTVSAPPPTTVAPDLGSLPATGRNQSLAAWALGLILAGVVLVAVTRRRAGHRVPARP